MAEITARDILDRVLTRLQREVADLPVPCEECDQRFSRQSALEMHRRLKHPALIDGKEASDG